MEDFNREKQDMEYQFKSSMSGLEEEYKGIVRSQSEKQKILKDNLSREQIKSSELEE